MEISRAERSITFQAMFYSDFNHDLGENISQKTLVNFTNKEEYEQKRAAIWFKCHAWGL